MPLEGHLLSGKCFLCARFPLSSAAVVDFIFALELTYHGNTDRLLLGPVLLVACAIELPSYHRTVHSTEFK